MTEPEPTTSAPIEDAAADAPKGARLHGQLYGKLPEDLYIPPDAMEVVLEAFEGPLDLLLYLIRRQNLNILDIPVLAITRQYMEYIRLMRDLRFELAAEYLLMAALLAEIKSRMLLPRPPADEEPELGDPRMELVRRLQEYERFKVAGENLESQPRVGRELVVAQARPEEIPASAQLPGPTLRELLTAFSEVMHRAELFTHHQVLREPLSVRERMGKILARIKLGPASLDELVDPEEGRQGVVVCFLAILELARTSMLSMEQGAPFAPLMLDAARAHQTAAPDEQIVET